MQIETERLVLREFKKTDWKEVHEYAQDLEVCKYMIWGPNTADDTIEFVDLQMRRQKEKPRRLFDFPVILRSTNKLIGTCGLTLMHEACDQAMIGYCFNKSYWRQGFASEACLSLLKLAFETLNVHRAYATCDAENDGSAAVLRKVGMRQEAHFLQDMKVKGQWRDTLLFAMLKKEWETRHGGK